MNNYVIFVAGPPAAGKTGFSGYLSKKLGVLCVNKDHVKEILCDAVGFADRAENKRLSNATFELFLYLLEKSMRVKKPVIMESNFTRDEGKRLAALTRKYGYKSVTVMLHADMHVLHKRFLARLDDRVNVRHAAHRSVALDNFEDFRQAAEACMDFDAGGPIIAVDTTDFETIDYDGILFIIDNLLSEGEK